MLLHIHLSLIDKLYSIIFIISIIYSYLIIHFSYNRKFFKLDSHLKSNL